MPVVVGRSLSALEPLAALPPDTESLPSFPSVSSPVAIQKKALLVGICGLKTHDPEYIELKGSHNDVFSVRDLLLELYHYKAEDITILIDSPGYVEPTRDNILNAIKTLVKDAKAGDRFCFHYCGHSIQVPNRSHTEEDGMDECIIPYDGKDNIILDNELNEFLVKPLPAGAYLVAVLDACHSGTMLDLKHDKCNQVHVPWLSRSEEPRVGRRNGKMFSRSRQVTRRTTSRLLAQPAEINMNLITPSPRTTPPPPRSRRGVTCDPPVAYPPSSRTPFPPPRTALNVSHLSGSGANGLIARVRAISRVRSTPFRAANGPPAPWSDSLSRVPNESPREGENWILPEHYARPDSPISMFTCNGFCRDAKPGVADWDDANVVKADVISLASCADPETTYEDEDGKSMTAALVEILRRDLNQSVKDVLISISHSMYTNALIRHTKAKTYGERYKALVERVKHELDLLPATPTIAPSPTDTFPRRKFSRRWLEQIVTEFSRSSESEYDTSLLQNPQLASARPLDMNRQWKM
ncbi:caspase domain-containing protein [Mycena metata]|uniref:Caspase domain-containing protein n=1 Tax=Mycena metata TaxID=1033252 RepID=A0AAD7JDM4_9AGAR|nr:caspase domain-containing protein [Mycena metata]